MKKIIHSFPLFYSLLFLYFELIFHIFLFQSLSISFFYVIGFSLFGGFLFGALTDLIPAKIGIWFHTFFISLIALFFIVEVVYQAVFQKFLALFSMMGVAGQAFDFMDVITKNILHNLLLILFFLLPIPIFLFCCKKHYIHLHAFSVKECFQYIGIGLEFYLITIFALNIGSTTPYSPFDVYYHNISSDMTAEQFGILTMNRLDGYYCLFGKPEKTLQVSTEIPEEDVEEEEIEAIDTSPNVLPIDFDHIIANAPNDSVVQLSQYFQSQPGTNKNAYTGMFSGYNVIFITAEGFSKYVIDKERTPVLYRLKNEGFVFQNYYTPGWYASTSDGEYANLTGLLPNNGLVSMKMTGENGTSMKQTLGRQLEALGYTLNGYHNNSYTYYGRDLSHPNMGYNWHGTGNWFVPEKNESGTDLWPQSDYEMIIQSMPDYMDKEPFHTYYMSVSGHMLYNWTGNQMCIRNQSLVSDLPYSETTKAYLACQMELEKAVAALVDELEQKGIADRTVIVIGADHVPYDDKPVSDELAGHELESAIEWYQNDLIIWSGSMEEPVIVDKYCYAVDILPTLSNLLGLEYDSRLLLGQDILSDAEQLVCFPDRSFISGKCIYNASNGSITPLTEEDVSPEYVENMSSIVYNKFIVSEMMLKENYFQYIP